MHFLNDQERTQLKIQHKQERDGRVRDRIKAVLLYDKGWSPQQIAEALFISDQAVRNHIDDYKTSSKLNPESGGSNEKLSQKQSDQLVVHLREHTYLLVCQGYRSIRASDFWNYLHGSWDEDLASK